MCIGIDTDIERNINFKELAHMIKEAPKSKSCRVGRQLETQGRPDDSI